MLNVLKTKVCLLIVMCLLSMCSYLMGEEVSVRDSNFYTSKAKELLEWNKDKLTSHSNLTLPDIAKIFAPEFVVSANGRIYQANDENYYEFLNKFRANIESINYKVQEYVVMGSTVVMPLTATVKRVQGNVDVFTAIMLIKFNDDGKIIHWQEVYCKMDG